MAYEKLNYYWLASLVEFYYGLVTYGAIFWLSSGEDPNIDPKVIISYVNFPQILKHQGNAKEINMYVMPRFDQEECSKDPFLMQLRNKLVNKTKRPCRTKEPQLVIDKQQLHDNGKGVIQ